MTNKNVGKETLTKLKTHFLSKHQTKRIYKELILKPIISLEGFLGSHFRIQTEFHLVLKQSEKCNLLLNLAK